MVDEDCLYEEARDIRRDKEQCGEEMGEAEESREVVECAAQDLRAGPDQADRARASLAGRVREH